MRRIAYPIPVSALWKRGWGRDGGGTNGKERHSPIIRDSVAVFDSPYSTRGARRLVRPVAWRHAVAGQGARAGRVNVPSISETILYIGIGSVFGSITAPRARGAGPPGTVF
eukprot:5210035-Prymnesium_polylepis.2